MPAPLAPTITTISPGATADRRAAQRHMLAVADREGGGLKHRRLPDRRAITCGSAITFAVRPSAISVPLFMTMQRPHSERIAAITCSTMMMATAVLASERISAMPS